MRKRALYILVILIFLVGLVICLVYNGYIRFNYPSINKFNVRGIDISHHQGEINWGKLKNENFKFIFIKATEGGDFKDPKFYDNWNQSKAYGFYIGAYHFYRFCKTGNEQAANFINTVPKEKNMLPPVIDLEYGGNCKTNKSKPQIINEINDYIEIVRNYYGKDPILYVTTEFYDDYVVNNFSNSRLWIRNIYFQPNLDDNRNWIFWQYANRGHVAGITGYVDLNVFNGDFNKFKLLIDSTHN